MCKNFNSFGSKEFQLCFPEIENKSGNGDLNASGIKSFVFAQFWTKKFDCALFFKKLFTQIVWQLLY